MANSLDGTVTRLNLDGTALDTYTVGNAPHGIIFDGQSIWVSNSGDGTLYQLDLKGTLLSTLTVGNAPAGLAFDGASMWLANQGDDTVSKLVGDNVVLGSFSVGDAPAALTFDGTNIWVAESGAGTVSSISFDRSVQSTIAVGTEPYAVAYNGTSLWVANRGDGALVRVRFTVGALSGGVENDFDDGDEYKIFGTRRAFGSDNSGVNDKTTSVTDSAQNFISQGVVVGHTILNITDGSYGTITDVSPTTLTFSGGLHGGFDNVFDNGDRYDVIGSELTSGVDNSGLDDKTDSMTDSTKNFFSFGVVTGSIIFNLTDGSHGTITSPSATKLTFDLPACSLSAQGLPVTVDGVTLCTHPVGASPVALIVGGENLWVANLDPFRVSKLGLNGTVLGTYSVAEAPGGAGLRR